MFDFSIDAAKSGFFDTEAVVKATDSGTRRVLSQFGAYVRQRSRTSIRKRRRVSSPGSPPSSHAGDLKRLILFSYDFDKKSVVIGPTLFRSRSLPTVPELLEEGGAVERDGKSAFYRPRPYMRPAFEAEMRGRLASKLKNMVTRGNA